MVAPFTTGSGEPVTLVAHGIGATVAETRPLAGGVPGTRVFGTARGHAGGEPVVDPGYGELATDLRALADATGATQALGVSLGAGALLRLLAADPERFSRLVLFLPAALDRPRSDLSRASALADAVARNDVAGVLAEVEQEVPADLRGLPGVSAYLAVRSAALAQMAGLAPLLRALPLDRPVPDRGVLGAVTADVLVIGQEGDPLHPAQVARELAAALPRARLVVFDRPGAALRERARLRALIGQHLGG